MRVPFASILCLCLLAITAVAQPAKKFKPTYKVGVAAIVWAGKDSLAVVETAQVGLKGLQLRANLVKTLADPAKLLDFQALLKTHKVQVPVFSGGNVNLDKSDEALLEEHKRNIAMAKALGATYYQMTNSSRPKDGSAPTADMLKEYARKLVVVGREVKAAGMVPVYHNHMHQLGETPAEVDAIMEALKGTDVKLLLDVAHYAQGGGDAVQAITKYKDVLQAVHLKDVKDAPEQKHGYQFVELGVGRLDIAAITRTLQEVKFRGWAMIELDAVPAVDKTALGCTQTSVTYLRTQAGLDI